MTASIQTPKTVYRRFVTKTTGEHFVITEIAGTERHPMNWGGSCEKIDGQYVSLSSHEGAWQAACSQHLPVHFVGLDGAVRDLGVCFSPEQFERRAYSGYVGYGLSMTDGYYAPVTFEHWVADFRSEPVRNLRHGNDFDAPQAALDMYLASFAAV